MFLNYDYFLNVFIHMILTISLFDVSILCSNTYSLYEDRLKPKKNEFFI